MIDKYQENNPLSQLSFILMRNRGLLTLNTFNDSVNAVRDRFDRILDEHRLNQEFNLHNTLQMKSVSGNEPLGQISLLKGLHKCQELFETSPLYFYKEVYIVLSSSNTNDNEDIFSSLEYFKANSIRISIISLNCTCFLYEKIVDTCNGKLAVPANREELEDYIFDIAEPIFMQMEKTLNCNFKVSFPFLSTLETPILCMCHDKLV